MSTIVTGEELRVGDFGTYTSKDAFLRTGGRKWFSFECIGRHDGKAIIETGASRLHKKGKDFVFNVLGNNGENQ